MAWLSLALLDVGTKPGDDGGAVGTKYEAPALAGQDGIAGTDGDAAAAKDAGFDAKGRRPLIAIRREPPAEGAEQETLFDRCERALGMQARCVAHLRK